MSNFVSTEHAHVSTVIVSMLASSCWDRRQNTAWAPSQSREHGCRLLVLFYVPAISWHIKTASVTGVHINIHIYECYEPLKVSVMHVFENRSYAFELQIVSLLGLLRLRESNVRYKEPL